MTADRHPQELGEAAPIQRVGLTSKVQGWLSTPTQTDSEGAGAPYGRLVVVMHGVLRNAGEYLDSWRAWSQATSRPVLAPHFDTARWPRATAYNLGNVLTKAGLPTPRSTWSFTALNQLVEQTLSQLPLADRSWDLFGHSAGAQFAHRLALLAPTMNLRSVIVAGSGWFTVPDPALDWPYGTRHTSLGIGHDALRAWTRRRLVLMRGEHDTVRDDHLRTGTGADAQGATRWHRAAHMLETGRAYDPHCRWRLIDVPGAKHDQQPMAAAAQRHWTTQAAQPRDADEPASVPCVP